MSKGRGSSPHRGHANRQLKSRICVFYEGESEKQYVEQWKETFEEFAVFVMSKKPGLFEDAVRRFQKDAKYKDYIKETNEVWFFFDTRDIEGVQKTWDVISANMNKLRRLCRSSKLRVRLLMTTGCLEYWLLLHFQKCQPVIQTKEQRKQIERDLDDICQKEVNLSYIKGNQEVTKKIYESGWPKAVENGSFYLGQLEKEGLPSVIDPILPTDAELDERYKWLLQYDGTFTTVQEAVLFLKHLEGIRGDGTSDF